MNIDDILLKIKSIPEAIEWRKELRKQGKKLVMTNGCFDILHKGHATYLINSRSLGDKLILAINSDNSVKQLKGPTRPVTNENDRAFLLACLAFVDAVVIFDTVRCVNIIKQIEPDIYVKGADYDLEKMDQTERAALESVNAKICFIPFVDGYSTTKIITKMKDG